MFSYILFRNELKSEPYVTTGVRLPLSTSHGKLAGKLRDRPARGTTETTIFRHIFTGGFKLMSCDTLLIIFNAYFVLSALTRFNQLS